MSEELRDLRDLAAELGLELIHLNRERGEKYAKITSANFSPSRLIGALKDGIVFIKPCGLEELKDALRKGVIRQTRRTGK